MQSIPVVQENPVVDQIDRATDRKIRRFSLSQEFLRGFQGKQPKWPSSGLGYFTYKRTYARTKDDGTTEEFWETCKRVVEGCFTLQKIHCRHLRTPWNDAKAQRSAQDMYQRMWDFKWSPPGRGLWMMGTDYVYDRGSACLNNCAFVTTENIAHDFAEPFCFLMDMSMLGVGVGADTRGAGKVRIRQPEYTDEVYVVEDSREGWVDLLRIVLNSFVGRSKMPSEVDYSQVRERGVPILGFGGTASGPGPLKELVQHAIRTLTPAIGELITSTIIVDLFNFTGKCVVAGGVRRSAEIMFGEADDEEFLMLKQDMEALSERRWVSNNSVFAKVGMDYSRISELVATNGEPGVIWLDNLRGYGRMMDPRNDKDARVMGMNPCAEQPLEDHELCCLVETYPAHHESLEDYLRTIKMAYLYGKAVTLVPTHNPKTNAVMMRNRRIGCSMSGIVQAMARHGRREFFRWCDEGYQYIQGLDKTYSQWLCIPESIKTTSVKPSGTVSLLAGATPGIHYPHSEYYIRRIRVSNTSPLVQSCIDAGYHVEPDHYADDTAVVSFPVREENFDRGESDVSVWEQFSNVMGMQCYWADNSVSVTIKFHESETDDIQRCLEMSEDRLKSVSFLKHSDHGYVQAPYEAIDQETYETMMSRLSPLDLSDARHEVTDRFCDGDKCELPWAAPEEQT